MLLPNQLNRHTADALCTVIALGFLSIDKNNDYKSNFIFEDNESMESTIEHEILHNLMSTSEILELNNLFPSFQKQYDKTSHPFIYARRNQAADPVIDQVNIDNIMHNLAEDLERICNEVFPNLRGAYIGGVIESTMIRLLCPSLLYQYDIPNYVDNNQNYLNKVANDYRNFEDTTEKVLDLFANLIENQKGDEGIQIWSTIDDLRELVNGMPQQIIAGHIFGSVHGLVTSMTMAHPNTLEDGNYNIELSLSNGTNKVGSCIPCAIFAMSQGAPSSYAHLGRGDYWNIPTDCDPMIKNEWINFVNECYLEGMRFIGNYMPVAWVDFFARLNNELNHLNTSYVPDVFLSALTFESSFVKKMSNTLAIINVESLLTEPEIWIL